MVMIAELKAVESTRLDLLKRLKDGAVENLDLWSAATLDERKFRMAQVPTLESAGLIECEYNDNRHETWYWLTEKGWHLLGYQEPDYYGNPFCEECDGSGKEPKIDADDVENECEWCHGKGIDIYPGFDLIPLDQE